MADGPKRSTVELMVLMLTATVCAALLLLGGSIAVIEVVNPTADTTGGVTAFAATVEILTGAVLGLIAGHSTARMARRHDERDDEP